MLCFGPLMTAPASADGLKKRYTPHEIRLIAYADILRQQCGMQITKKARKTYDDIIMRSIIHGEEKLNIFEKYYYRFRTADHNPMIYVVKKRGSRTTYARRPGDGLHLLVNDVVKNIYLLPCDKIVKSAKRNRVYKTLYQ